MFSEELVKVAPSLPCVAEASYYYLSIPGRQSQFSHGKISGE